MNYNIRRTTPRINYQDQENIDSDQDLSNESYQPKMDQTSELSFQEQNNEQEDFIKPYKMFENIQQQNHTLEALQQLTNDYEMTFIQIKDRIELSQAPLKFLKKKDLQYLIKIYRQKKWYQKQNGGQQKTQYKNLQQILGKRKKSFDDEVFQIKSQKKLSSKFTHQQLRKFDQSLAEMLLQTYHQLDKNTQLKVATTLDDLLNNDKDILEKMIKLQVEQNLQIVLKLYENNEKYELEQHLKTLHPISIIQLHIQISLTNNTFTEEGNTLSKTLLPYLNKLNDYNFLQKKDLFIITRFLHSLVRHITDTNTIVEKGFIICGLTLDPQILQNIFINNKNLQPLIMGLQEQGLSQESCLIISEHPKKFLWPQFLTYLRKQSQEQINEKLYILKKIKIFIDPGQQIILLDNILDQRRLLVDILLNTEEIQISLEEIIQCMDNLKYLQNTSIQQCLSKDSKEWLQISKRLLSLEMNEEQQLDDNIIQEILKEKLYNVESPVALEEMFAVSKQICQECPIYRHSNYQCAIATVIASFIQSQVIIVIIPTGAGKTWIEALVCKYFCNKNKKVGLMEPNDVLVQQTAEKIGSIDYSLNITSISQFYEFQFNFDIMIFDEFDEIFINNHYHTFQNNISGLWNFKSKKVIGFTATSNQAFEKFVNNILIKPQILKFQSEFEVKQGISPIQMGNIISFSNLQTLYSQFKKDITKFYDNKPIIIIYDNSQLEIIEQFMKNQKLRYLIGPSEINITTIRQWEYGVLLLKTNESRGIDTKFAVNSVVLILSEIDNEFQFQQMLGRSSRTRGICEGYLYLKSDEKTTEIKSRFHKQNFHSFMQLEIVHKLISKKYDNQIMIEALNRAKIDGIVVKKIEDIQKLIDLKKYQQMVKKYQF